MDDSIKIPCLFIPVRRFNLLLPNSAIVEVLAPTNIEATTDDLPWIAGTIKWQKQTIAVIAFDNLEKENHSDNPKKSIIIIIRNPAEKNSMAFFGLVVKTLPQVLDASTYNIDINPHPTSTHSYSLASVLVNEKEAIIPNIEVLAKLISKHKKAFLSGK